MTCSELSNLIIQNRDSIAFMVGNGIHLYEQHEKHVKGKIDWESLINKIREELTPSFDIKEEQPTKKFDTIVLEKDKRNFEENVFTSAENLTPYIENVQKIKINKEIRFDESFKHKYYPYNLSPSISFLESPKMLQMETKITERINKILSSVGISLDPNCFDVQRIARKILMHGETTDYTAKLIIYNIFKEYSLQDWIKPFLSVAEAFNTPILTTNYDISLSKLCGMKQRVMLDVKRKQTGFPFETYYAKSDVQQPWNSFSIWHINGIYNYINSIRIGQNDYENLKREIQLRLNETVSPNTDKTWSGNKNWLSIIFRKDLFIFGLKLSKEETVLRWLLEERAKYRLKGWYLYRQGEEMNNEKKVFLNNCGIKTIEIENKDLHENVWQKIINEYEV